VAALVAVAPAVAELLQAEVARSFSKWSPTKRLHWEPGGQVSGGPVLPKNRHVPERSCVACGAKMPKAQLVRVAQTSQGPITVDVAGRGPGRGAYLCRIPDCWGRAISKGALDRSFKKDLSSQDLESVRTYYETNIAPQTTAP